MHATYSVTYNEYIVTLEGVYCAITLIEIPLDVSRKLGDTVAPPILATPPNHATPFLLGDRLIRQ